MSNTVELEAKLITKQRDSRLATGDRVMRAPKGWYAALGPLNAVFVAREYMVQPRVCVFGRA
jgi:hypothetical protein